MKFIRLQFACAFALLVFNVVNIDELSVWWLLLICLVAVVVFLLGFRWMNDRDVMSEVTHGEVTYYTNRIHQLEEENERLVAAQETDPFIQSLLDEATRTGKPVLFSLRSIPKVDEVYDQEKDGPEWPDVPQDAEDKPCTRKGCGRPKSEHEGVFCP